MVDMQTKVMTPGQRMKARIQRVKDMRKVDGVRVEPCDGDGFTADQMRRLLKHPKAGGFRSQGSIEWPNDTYTNRRLREGSVRIVEGRQEKDRRSETNDQHE